VALLGLALFTPNASADLVVDHVDGADPAIPQIYELVISGSFEARADHLAVSQTLGPNTVNFEITTGADVILVASGTPCSGFGTQFVTCNFAEGIDRLEVTLGEQADVASSTAPIPTEWSGGPGDDELTGGTGPNWIEGGAGVDVLKGRQGPDEILGQAGNDEIDGGNGADTLDGGPGFGFDKLNGEGGPDILIGGTQNDTLNGGADADQLYGGDGEDNLEGGNGPDYISGGPDFFNDTLTYATRVNPITVSIDGVADDGGPEDGHGDNVDTDVEVLIAGSGDDQLTSASFGSEIDGGPGDDTLTGGPGHDFFTGSAGDDTMTLGAALNNAAGGTGDDTILGGADAELLDGGPDDDTLVGGGGLDRLRGMEGNDALDAVDGAADQEIDCGDGIDGALTDTIDPAAIGCETEDHPPGPPGPGDPGGPGGPGGPGDPADSGATSPLGRLAGKRIQVKFPSQGKSGKNLKGKPTARPRLECPAQATGSCTGQIVLKAKRGKKLIKIAKGRYELEPGARQRIGVALNKKGRALLSRKRKTKGKAILVGDDRRTQKVTFIRKR
jgi:hypothetical protein